MNNIESFVYNAVRRNPALKQAIRNLYQQIFDLMPRKKDHFSGICRFKEDYFFGFHDISPFPKNESKLLANHLLFDLRMPRKGEGLDVGYFDIDGIQMGDFHKVDTSFAWNYHKGCRLQWINNSQIIFNTAINDRLVSKITDIDAKKTRTIDYPIDSVYSDKNTCLATSFSYERLERCMPGYGYPYQDGGKLEHTAPNDTGLFLIDLNTNSCRLLVSLSELAQTVDSHFKKGYLHFVTHSEFSKDGRYISFLYRRIPIEGNYMKRYTKMMVYDLQESQLIELPTQESGSHYVWNNKNQLLASCIINGKSCHVLFNMADIDNYQIIAGDILNSDGHQSFITDTSFVTDTYPDKYRMAKVYKVDVITQKVELLVSVYSPKKFQTKDFKCHIACDLHPRVSPSGKYICFDSPRTGKRGLYIMPIN